MTTWGDGDLGGLAPWTSLGHAEVATYIQSGNAVMTSRRTDRAALAAEICSVIKDAHGLSVSAVLRSPKELSAALATYPYPDDAEGSRLIAFLSEAPTAGNAAALEPERFLPDRFELHGSELHLLYPNGAGRSKMTLDYFEKRLRVKGTARNLNTVAKLVDLSAR